jgi:hypothetical protein
MGYPGSSVDALDPGPGRLVDPPSRDVRLPDSKAVRPLIGIVPMG